MCLLFVALLEAAFSAHYFVSIVDVEALGGGCGGEPLAVKGIPVVIFALVLWGLYLRYIGAAPLQEVFQQ